MPLVYHMDLYDYYDYHRGSLKIRAYPLGSSTGGIDVTCSFISSTGSLLKTLTPGWGKSETAAVAILHAFGRCGEDLSQRNNVWIGTNDYVS